ncbi:hypothetical protein [Ensifer sp. 4252]|uniref:hypothetical protein n=1 Tax=Ensifer sp. 4252 TaxID=3373915 RepID=UPI003D1C4564
MTTSATDVSAETGAYLDPSCSVVNRAYSNARATEVYGGQIFEVKSDGTYALMREYRFRKKSTFSRWVNGQLWNEKPRVDPPLLYSSGARFTSCRLIKGPTSSEEGSHYTAKWYGAPYRGKVELWLTSDESKLRKILATYDDYLRPAPYASQVELFNYDPDNTEFPKP